jgi:CheY-like chemotaxis protein
MKQKARTHTDSSVSAANPGESESRDPRSGTLAAPTILVVDDDPDMRDYIRRCLKKLTGEIGQILEAVDGVEALARIRESGVDMVISDVVMPRMDGFELCRNVWRDVSLRHVSILLVTGERSHRDVREQAGTSMSIEVVTKPFNADTICAKVRLILSRAPPDRGSPP